MQYLSRLFNPHTDVDLSLFCLPTSKSPVAGKQPPLWHSSCDFDNINKPKRKHQNSNIMFYDILTFMV